jgi:hypothetical protein
MSGSGVNAGPRGLWRESNLRRRVASFADMIASIGERQAIERYSTLRFQPHEKKAAMKHTPSMTLAAALLTMTATAHAECGIGYCRGVGTQVAQTVTATSAGVYFMAPSGASLGCTLVDGIHMFLDRNNPAFKDIYATYLSAIAQGQYFQLSVDSSVACTIAYIRVWN